MGAFVKKWFHLVLIFVFAYLAGSLAGQAANQFSSAEESTKNAVYEPSQKPVALTENGIPIYSASADGNWGLSFPSPGQAPVGTDHPMAGDDDGDGVVSDRPAHRLAGQAFPPHPRGHFPGDISIGDDFPVGDPHQEAPYSLPEIAAGRLQRQLRSRGPQARKITIEPVFRGMENRNFVRGGEGVWNGSPKVRLALQP